MDFDREIELHNFLFPQPSLVWEYYQASVISGFPADWPAFGFDFVLATLGEWHLVAPGNGWKLVIQTYKNMGKPWGRTLSSIEIISSWWLNQPIWKIWSSNWIISPTKGENKQCLKPPPRYHLGSILSRQFLWSFRCFCWINFHK